jgi:putative transposase
MSCPRSTYYWRPDPVRAAARAAAAAAFRAAVEAVAAEWPAYGYRRVTQELKRRGWRCNHKRVARVLRESALTVRRVRRFLATTATEAGAAPPFPNLVPTLRVTGPNQLWAADLTYIRLAQGFVFLAVVLDVWSRRVVGYALSTTLEARLPLAALEAAIAARQPPPGLVHHSDQGVQYTAKAYRHCLAHHGLRGSMARRGNPYDNAYAESFLKTLKCEELYAGHYATLSDVTARLPHFLDEIYNRRRLHSALGYRPPEEFETLDSHHLTPAA